MLSLKVSREYNYPKYYYIYTIYGITKGFGITTHVVAYLKSGIIINYYIYGLHNLYYILHREIKT